MASIKNSLRKIYTALGGTSSKSKTITGLLDDISTVASSGGGDNNNFIVPIIYDATDDTYRTPITFSQIMDAYENGKTISGIYINYNSGVVTGYENVTNVTVYKQGPQEPIEGFNFILAETVVSPKSPTEHMVIFGITRITIDSSSSVSVTKEAYSTDVTELQF